MDEFTRTHLITWIQKVFSGESAQFEVYDSIYAFVRQYPDVVERGDSWPEILRLAN